ncbi:MAG: PD40 domain-containing protein [candidate division Zixibacteria bacterium]|nr:PD40 domain-containing protein [candidate division Zixibacteria bacterium]
MKQVCIVFLALVGLLTANGLAQQSQPPKLSMEKAGKISAPSGQIAFIRDKNVWVMNWDGSNQQKLVTAENADGRLSWSPDGKQIAFVRQGSINLQGPNNLGGFHKLYDVFVAFMDSLGQNSNWWQQITDNLGGRYPEWQPDGKTIVFTNDMNANYVNSVFPNYQTCAVNIESGKVTPFLSDLADSTDLYAIMPTVGPDSLYAFVLFNKMTPAGVIISPIDVKTFDETTIRQKFKSIPKGYAPAWSPDGKWLAYILNDMSNQAIYITTPDAAETYFIYKPPVKQNLQTYPLSWASNSQWLTFGLSDGSLWIIDITGNGLKQIVPAGMNIAPAWSKHK